MRSAHIVAALMALMLLIPVQGGDVHIMQTAQSDENQPDANNTSLRIWSNGNQNHWSHFGQSDDQNDDENIWYGERENGALTVDLKFTMKPTLTKRLNLTIGDNIVGSIKVNVNGDYQDGDEGSCNNDCTNLTLTLKAGATIIWEDEFAPAKGSDETIPILIPVTEENAFWDKTAANPSLQVYMKLKGDQQSGIIPGTVQGTAAEFTLYLSGDNSSKIDFPVDPKTWDEAFQSDEEIMMAEESPGFTLVAGAVAMGMAAVWFKPGRDEDSNE